MSHDLEVAGAASLGGLTSGEHHQVQPPGEPCRNCGTVVTERYCTRCGQLASNFHRPFFSLVASSLADTFALDSRLWRSVPMLLFRPGRMTRNYLDGKRARYVPPFRMFLLSSVLFFLTVFGLGDRLGWYADWHLNPGTSLEQSAEQRGEAIAALKLQLEDEDLSEEGRAALESALATLEAGVELPFVSDDGSVDRDALHEAIEKATEEGATPEETEAFQAAGDQFARVFENQDRFAARFREWAPRFSLMFMPLLALMLTVVYVWHRRVYVYDHVITALHFQTFVYTLSTLLLLAAAFLHVETGWLVAIGALWLVWHLYRLLRETYRTGRFMAVLRTGILLFFGTIILSLLLSLMIVVSILMT
jgi:hypothetical protein